MSNATSEPSLDDYPGYFPVSKPPFWTRTKVGVAATIVGVVLGSSAASGSAEPPAPRTDISASQVSPDEVDQAVEAAVEEATEDLEDQLLDKNGELTTQQAKLVQQKRDAAQALKQAKNQAVAAQRRAVTAAVNRTRAQVRANMAAAAPAPAPQPQLPVAPGGGTDPQFSYCYEANDAGYGPYFQGQDPEYAWYDDADGDGVVCES